MAHNSGERALEALHDIARERWGVDGGEFFRKNFNVVYNNGGATMEQAARRAFANTKAKFEPEPKGKKLVLGRLV